MLTIHTNVNGIGTGLFVDIQSTIMSPGLFGWQMNQVDQNENK